MNLKEIKTSMYWIHASASLCRPDSCVFLKDIITAYYNCCLQGCSTTKCYGCKVCKSSTTLNHPIHGLRSKLGAADGPPRQQVCEFTATGLQCQMRDMCLENTSPTMPAVYAPHHFNSRRLEDCTCSFHCQKHKYGIQLDSEFFRFAVPQFGIKTSSSMFSILLKPLLCQWRQKG